MLAVKIYDSSGSLADLTAGDELLRETGLQAKMTRNKAVVTQLKGPEKALTDFNDEIEALGSKAGILMEET